MKNYNLFNQSLGIIGGGQLGKMICIEAARLGYKVYIFTDQANSPASQVANKVFISNYTNKVDLKEWELII